MVGIDGSLGADSDILGGCNLNLDVAAVGALAAEGSAGAKVAARLFRACVVSDEPALLLLLGRMLGRGAGAGDAAPIGALSLHVAMSGRTRPGIGLGESGSGTTGSGRSSGLMSSAPLGGFLGWMRAGGMRAGRTQLGDFEDDVVDETRGVCGAALPRRRGPLFLRSVRSTPLTDRSVAKSTGDMTEREGPDL